MKSIPHLRGMQAVAFALGLATLLVVPSASSADENQSPSTDGSTAVDVKAAVHALDGYLRAVKAKKWVDAKRLTHPKTMESIAERKRRLGREDHPLAPWFLERSDYVVREYVVGAARVGPLGTVVVAVSEDRFQVQDKALAPGEPATYLLGRVGGQWVVIDKKNGGDFSDDSIRLGYKKHLKVDAAAVPSTEREQR